MRTPVAATEIGECINRAQAGAALGHGATRESVTVDGVERERLRVPRDFALSGPNVGKEMLFEYVPDDESYVRIKWEPKHE